jgi:hypothetical protein
MTSYPIAILLTSILFCTGTTVLAVMLKRSNSNKDQLLTKMQATMDARKKYSPGKVQELQLATQTNIFNENLRAAELTTRLQQPRLSVQQCRYSPATPERYRYIQSMVKNGMSAQEIASTLSMSLHAATLAMSLHETTQIVTLIRMAHPQQQER